MGAYDVRRRKLFGFSRRITTTNLRRLNGGQQFGGTAPRAKPRRKLRAKLHYRHRRGRCRIGRRCGCLPGAWVETGHAALRGPGQIADATRCLTSPNAAKLWPLRGRGRLPRVHRGRSTRSPRPRQAATPPADPRRGSRSAPSPRWQLRAKLLPCGTSQPRFGWSPGPLAWPRQGSEPWGSARARVARTEVRRRANVLGYWPDACRWPTHHPAEPVR